MIDGKLSIIPYRDHDNVGPAASVHSTSHDLAQYLLMFLNHGSFENRSILSPESIDFLHKPHMLYTQSQEETSFIHECGQHFQRLDWVGEYRIIAE
jgi:CubicO group peptidase (beta-lactamase class C family)